MTACKARHQLIILHHRTIGLLAFSRLMADKTSHGKSKKKNGSASKSALADLDIVRARGLRNCIGAIETTPVCAIQVEAGEMPLVLRRNQLKAN